MNQSTNQNLYELIPKGRPHEGLVIRKKRVLVGSSQACDLIVQGEGVASIHAVLEISKDQFKIFDMNTKTGTYVNGEKVVSKEVQLGDEIYLGETAFDLKPYSPEDIPPELDMLDPTLPPKMPKAPKAKSQKPSLPKKAPENLEKGEKKEEEVPTKTLETGPEQEKEEEEGVHTGAIYPLAKDPKAEFSEYIFEDVDTLFPIFEYDSAKSVEVIILFQDRIYTVDYLELKDGFYRLVGRNPKTQEIEYAYLGKNEKVDFIEVRADEVFIHKLHDYDFLCLGDENKDISESGTYLLRDDDIVRFQKGDLQVYIRKSESPPEVKPAPLMRRDKDFWKYIAIVFFFVISFLVGMSSFEVDPELEKEKAPERIASILYEKQLTASTKPAVDKTKDAPKEKIQKSPKQVKKEQEKKPEPKPKPTPQKKKKVAKAGSPDEKKTGEVKKAKPKKGPTNKKTKQVRANKNQPSGGTKSSRSESKKASSVKASDSGHVDTYKSSDFKGSLNSLMSKGGKTKDTKASRNTRSSTTGGGKLAGGGESAQVKGAEVSKDVGSLAGSASGKLDATKGVKGMVKKTEVYTAGLPFKEVVLGGMDPDVIRQILVENIPQFRYCYQQVLDKSSAAVQGVVKLDFIIGASGHVSKAGVETVSSELPSKVKSCVLDVLKGIRFPEPKGGGVVEVAQPMNFYPRSN